jgi:predicted metal-dependent phosphoesterase TrpH
LKTWLKADLHTHTADDPDDGGHMVHHSAQTLIEEAAKEEYEVLSITNHNQLLWSRELEKFAVEKGVVLVPGVEATFSGKHVLLYNFLDYDPSWNDPYFVRKRKGEEQMVIAPHPFFPLSTALRDHFFRWLDIFDAIEYSSLSLPRFDPNRKAERVARECGVPMVGNSDLHFLYQLGRCYSLVYAEKNRESVIHAIKAGNVKLVNQSGGVRFTAKWVLIAALRKFHTLQRNLAGQHG